MIAGGGEALCDIDVLRYQGEVLGPVTPAWNTARRRRRLPGLGPNNSPPRSPGSRRSPHPADSIPPDPTTGDLRRPRPPPRPMAHHHAQTTPAVASNRSKRLGRQDTFGHVI